MGAYDLFRTDHELEATKGIKLEYGDFWVGVYRAGGSNKRFARVLAAKLKPHRRALQTGTMDNDLAQRLLVEAFCEAVVWGWGGEIGRDGKQEAYSVEAGVQVFTDLPDLFRDVKEQAESLANFRREELEEDAGN